MGILCLAFSWQYFWDVRFQKIVHFKQLCLSKNTCSALKLSGPAMSWSTWKMTTERKCPEERRGLKSTRTRTVAAFSLEMEPCVHTAKPPEMWAKHHPRSLESWTSKTESVPWLRRRLQNPAFVSLNQGTPSGLWLPMVLLPRHSSFLLGLLLWVFFRPEVLLLGCSFSVHSCIWWGAFF